MEHLKSGSISVSRSGVTLCHPINVTPPYRYLKVIVNLRLLTTDTMLRVIEFLRAFNSRTCQVVLGAGAMRSAGLKNITAKHLALASQSLSIVIVFILYVREMSRWHLSPKQAVMLTEFDKLKHDYQEHQNDLRSVQ
ncbi:Vps54-like domain containing protein [Lactarius tabidus]